MTDEQKLTQIKIAIQLHESIFHKQRDDFYNNLFDLNLARRKLREKLRNERFINGILTLCRTGK